MKNISIKLGTFIGTFYSSSYQMANDGIADEGKEEREFLGKEKPEIEHLSDLIFGLALSIGALVLISQPPRSSTEIITDVISFSFSFFLLIEIWLHYTAAMAVMKVESISFIRLNVVLLFLVSLEPYFFFLLSSGPKTVGDIRIDDTASMLYAFDLGALFVILAFFSDRIAKSDHDKVHAAEVRQHGVYRAMFYSSGVILLASALPFFWEITVYGYPLRYYFWAGSVILIAVGSWYAGRIFHSQSDRSY